jgi:hypothetical protein
VGGRKEVSLVVVPKRKPPRGEARRYEFTVKATPADAPHLAKSVAGQLEVLRPKLGAVAWGAIGFALGNALAGLLWTSPLWRSFAYIISIPFAFVIAYAVRGAIGGLCLGIATKRRVLALLLAGAVGFSSLGLFIFDPTIIAIWGAFAGAVLGLALGYRWLGYRWKALALAVAGSLAFALPSLFGFGIVRSAIQGAIAGAVMGLALGYKGGALALAVAGSLAFALTPAFKRDLYKSIQAIAGEMLAVVIANAVRGGVIGAAFGLVIDIIEQRRTTP